MTSHPDPLLGHLQALGGCVAERGGRHLVTAFTSPAEEVAAARSGAAVFDWSDRGKMVFCGPDRARFLHGQCTQDIKGRNPGEGGYAFILEPNGRVVSDLRFLMLGNRLLAETPWERRADVRGRLERFILASDVRIEDVTTEYSLLLVAGPHAPEVIRAWAGVFPGGPEDSGLETTVDGLPVVIQADRSTGEVGATLWCPAAAAPGVLDALLARGRATGLVLAGREAMDVLRTEAGRPWFGVDIDEQVLPAEAGQDDRAVSYTKGCYCGQEVVARQHFIGKLRRRLCGLFPENDGARAGDPVVCGGEKIGQVTTAHRSFTLGRPIALAILRGADHPAGTACEIVPADGRSGMPAVVAELPFVRR